MATPKTKVRQIGDEWVRNDGMVLVKVSMKPNKWIYKQRKIWQDHFGEIPENHFIIFLDGDKTNYDIDNLMCVSSREASLMANYNMFSKDKSITKAGKDVADLLIEIKTKKGIKAMPKHRKKQG